jgi:hypothetical protein
MIGLQPATASTADSVLVIIDAQKEYISGQLQVTNAATSGPIIASVLARYRAAKAPVIHVLHKTPEGAPVFTPGTPLAEPFDELKPVEGESVVWKLYPGSFTDTDLQKLVEATGRKKIALVGYMVRFCSTPGDYSIRIDHTILISMLSCRPTYASQPLPARVPRGAGTSSSSRMALATGTFRESRRMSSSRSPSARLAMPLGPSYRARILCNGIVDPRGYNA